MRKENQIKIVQHNKENIKDKKEINEIEIKDTVCSMYTYSMEKINKSNESLDFNYYKSGDTQTTTIRNGRGDITIEPVDLNRTIKKNLNYVPTTA